MSLYIHQENQKLIWGSIHKLPRFQEFGKTEPGKQEAWFREIIQQFYESNKFKLLSIEELQQLNRETISYMLQDLEKSSTKSDFSSFYPGFSSSLGDMSPVNTEKQAISFPTTTPMQNTDYTRDAILEKKQEQLNQQFTTRQQEYGSMLNSAPTREINFRANIEEDVPMENIDRLIEDKMKQREYDLKSPPHSSVKLDVIDLGDQQSTNLHNTPQSISNEFTLQNLPVRSDNFPYKDITDNPPKSVRWNEQPIHESVKHKPPQYSRTNDNNMSVLKDFMEDMRDTMNEMRQEIQSLKATNDSLTKQPDSQNPLVNNILSRMKPKQKVNNDLQDVTNHFHS
jgi:hypothetical protein